MSDYFDKLEIMAVKERKSYFTRKMKGMIRLGYERSPRIRRQFDELGLHPADFKSLKDIWKIPVTSRERLVEYEQEEPPYGGLCATDADIDRVFISPGPVYEPHLSEADPLWARAYHAAGFRKGDVVLNAFSYHMVAAGLTFHGGLRRVGATVVPSGSSGTQQQVQLIRDLRVTGFTGTPSFLMAIIEKAEEMGLSFTDEFGIKRACFAAEPLQPALRERFEKQYSIDTYQMYGATEVGDVAYECGEKKGWHLCEEVLVEIVDPQTGKEVPHGELGEVVVTRFNPVFMLLRFGTGDLSRIIAEPCSCGRTSLRMAGIFGRVGDAVKVRGLFVAPSQLNAVRKRFEDVPIQILVSRSGHHDLLAVRIETDKTGSEREVFLNQFEKAFREVCTVKIDRIEPIMPGTLRNEKLIVDERNW